MESFFYILFLVLAFGYLLLIAIFTIAWIFVMQIKPDRTTGFTTTVSVVIAARNEEENISDCINDILKQDYNKALFEIIVVDDASVDTTRELIINIIDNHPAVSIKLITLTGDESVVSPKKKALQEAIKAATGKLIVSTDADCRMGSKWLSSIISFYEEHHPKMVIGPVKFSGEENVFQKMQSLEFSSLIGITGAAAFLNKPIMCNGANLIYEKEAFEMARGFENNIQMASGDDIFLMLKFKKIFGNNSVRFIKSREAMVSTKAQKTVSDFFHQRKRWASKSFYYHDFTTMLIAGFIFLFNISIVISLGLSFFSNKFTELFLLIAGIKCFADFIFIFAVSSFFEKRNLLWLVIPEQVLYIFYIASIGITAPFGGYKWKGRKLH